MIKVSVIVPIYNVEKYIGELVESLINQTLREIEIILVDDGSPDRSGIICDQFAKNDSRIHVIHKPNGGVSAARNDGLKIANGEYVIFCDSDDWLPSDAFEKMYNESKTRLADIVIGDVYLSENDNKKLVHFYDKPFVTSDTDFIRKLVQADIYKTYCPCPYNGTPAFGYGGPWNKIVKRELLVNNNIEFDIRVKGIFDDILYTAYILANAKKVAYIQEPVYYYRIIASSITHSYKPNVLEINNAIFNSWQEFMEKYGRDGLYQKPYYGVIIRRFVETLPVYFLSVKNPKPFSEKIHELSEVINEPVYQEAISGADPDKLTVFHKQVWKLMKRKSALGIFMMQKMKQVIKKIKG